MYSSNWIFSDRVYQTDPVALVRKFELRPHAVGEPRGTRFGLHRFLRSLFDKLPEGYLIKPRKTVKSFETNEVNGML